MKYNKLFLPNKRLKLPGGRPVPTRSKCYKVIEIFTRKTKFIGN